MTEQIKKIVFFDRDGVINKKAAENEYITDCENFVFNEGIFEFVKFYKKNGYEFILITNQRGIARKLFTEEKLKEIHQKMLDSFRKHEIAFLDIFYCPHNHNECDCRKPKPGLLKKATDKYTIDLKKSILISDSEVDVDMGVNFGIGKNILIEVDQPSKIIKIK